MISLAYAWVLVTAIKNSDEGSGNMMGLVITGMLDLGCCIVIASAFT